MFWTTNVSASRKTTRSNSVNRHNASLQKLSSGSWNDGFSPFVYGSRACSASRAWRARKAPDSRGCATGTIRQPSASSVFARGALGCQHNQGPTTANRFQRARKGERPKCIVGVGDQRHIGVHEARLAGARPTEVRGRPRPQLNAVRGRNADGDVRAPSSLGAQSPSNSVHV